MSGSLQPLQAESSSDEGNNGISEGFSEDLLIRLIELKVDFSKELSNAESWTRVSNQLNIDVDRCKQSFSKAFSSFQEHKLEHNNRLDSKLFLSLDRLEKSLEFDYCLENFSNICRFCCRLRSDLTGTREIFDDSSDEKLDSSKALMDKIHYSLYDNMLDRVDFKLSNLICESCNRQVEGFYAFKKQCDHNAHLLNQVKDELDKMHCRPELNDSTFEDFVHDSKTHNKMENEDDMENEDEELLDSSDENSHDEDIEEIEEMSEDEHSTGPLEKPFRPKVKKVIGLQDSRDRSRKSYKGKNSQCPICGKLVKGIQMHMLIHTGERRHKCSYCVKTFTQSGQLKRHINSHLNIRNYKCPEPGCERTFVDPSSVTKHLVVHNKEDRKYQCSLCGSRFNRLGALRYHEKTHRQERNHSCDICKKSFLAKYDLTKHLRVHTGEKPYKCKFCDKRFSISKNAKVHLRVHTKEKPYACKFCDLSFAYRSSMKNHLIKIHNHADVSSLPLLQAINIAIRNDSDNELEQSQLNTIESIEGLSMDLAGHI